MFRKFLALEVIYLILIIISAYSEYSELKTISNYYAAAFAPIMIAIVISHNSSQFLKLPRYFSFLYLCYGAFIIIGYVLHPGDFGDFTKILLSPIFFIAGYNIILVNKDLLSRLALLMVFVFLSTPLLIGYLEMLSWVDPLGSNNFSVFSNRNNASLYAICLLALFNLIYDTEVPSVLLAIFVGLSFGTLGIFLAVITSIIIVYHKYHTSRIVIIGSVFILIYSIASNFFEFLVLERFVKLVQNLKYVDLSTVSTTSFGSIVETTGSTDLSFFFRIKHWNDILSLILDNPYSLLFGFGIGESINNTKIGLLPHNDYLRLLYECGIFVFISFILIVVFIIKNIGLSYRLIPYLTVSIYFVSENLITNYLAMSLFFITSGIEISRKFNSGVRFA